MGVAAALPIVVAAWMGAVAGGLQPLQDSRCDLPPALKGVTGHALVKYVVDGSGTVSFVEATYADARPETQRLAFIQALESCVRGWRYKPAPGGTSFNLLMAFHYLEAAPAGAPLVGVGEGRSMPLSHFEEIRREKLKLAARLLAGPDYGEFTGAGWILRTDAPRRDARGAEEALRFAAAAFDAMFPSAPPLPRTADATVLLFKDEDEFKQVAAFDNMIRMHFAIAGQYNSQEQIIYTSIGVEPTTAASVLAHEITHHFVSQRLYQGARKPAFWVNEGIATFVESLRRPKNGKVDLDSIDTEARRGGNYLVRPHAAVFLEVLKAEARSGRFASLPDYLDVKEGQRKPVEEAYAMSWLLVHYLMNSHAGRYREAFRHWVMDPSGVDGTAGLSAAVGVPFEEIVKDLPDYVWRMGLPH